MNLQMTINSFKIRKYLTSCRGMYIIYFIHLHVIGGPLMCLGVAGSIIFFIQQYYRHSCIQTGDMMFLSGSYSLLRLPPNGSKQNDQYIIKALTHFFSQYQYLLLERTLRMLLYLWSYPQNRLNHTIKWILFHVSISY